MKNLKKFLMIIKNHQKNFIILIFLIFVICCSLFPISSAVITKGIFSYDTAKKPIKINSSAVVEKVFVKNGQKIKNGEKIMQLNSLKELTDNNIAKYKLLYSLIEQQILELENIAINNNKINELNIQNKLILKNFSQSEINEFSYILAKSQQIIKSFIEKYQNDLAILTYKRNNYLQEVNINQQKSKIILKQITKQEIMLKNNYVDENFLNELKKQRLELIMQIQSVNNNILAIDKQIKSLKNENILDISKKILENSLSININTQQLDLNQDILKRTTINSPADGFIEDLKYFSAGDVIEFGSVIANIVPLDPQLIIVAKLKAVDIDNINFNQDIEIFLKNFYEKNLPKINGKIFFTSRDAKYDENLQDYFYEIKILISKYQKHDLKLIAGMPVEIYILQKNRNLLSYIYSPILKSLKNSFNELF
jgi:HlyD family type I secretion membrane fusion protein